ncbi:MAG TPA: pilus assembly protein PilM [Ignavibacteria bacterium]
MNTNLGISFSDNKIYFAELSEDNGSYRLHHVESRKVNFDFEDSFYKHKANQKYLTNIASEIQNYINKQKLNTQEAALTIGTSQAFMLTLPVDYSEGKQSMNSKIYWELSNYFPDNYNEFIVNTYRLNSNMPCKDSDEFLIIAVHKNTLEFINRIFRMCNLNLKLIDIDHFSAEYSFRTGYGKQIENKKVLIVGLKKGRVDYGYIHNMKYKNYMYSRYGSDIEFNLSVVKKLNSIFDNNSETAGTEAIYLYGDNIKENTVEAIRKLDKVPVEIINPFNGINAVQQLLNDDNLRKNAYKFAASCGAALRSFTRN